MEANIEQLEGNTTPSIFEMVDSGPNCNILMKNSDI